MPYLLIEDGFADNAKITGLSHQAYRLHTIGLVWCAKHLTDGSISKIALRWVSDHAQIGRPKRYVSELERAGLWVPNSGQWEIHDYLVHNPSRAEMEAKRRNNRDRKRRHDSKRNAPRNALRNDVSNASSHASKDPPQRALTRSLGAEPSGGSPHEPPPASRQRAALALAETLAHDWTTPDSEAFSNALDELEANHRTVIGALDRERLWETAWHASANGTTAPPPDIARLAGHTPLDDPEPGTPPDEDDDPEPT